MCFTIIILLFFPLSNSRSKPFSFLSLSLSLFGRLPYTTLSIPFCTIHILWVSKRDHCFWQRITFNLVQIHARFHLICIKHIITSHTRIYAFSPIKKDLVIITPFFTSRSASFSFLLFFTVCEYCSLPYPSVWFPILLSFYHAINQNDTFSCVYNQQQLHLVNNGTLYTNQYKNIKQGNSTSASG